MDVPSFEAIKGDWLELSMLGNVFCRDRDWKLCARDLAGVLVCENVRDLPADDNVLRLGRLGRLGIVGIVGSVGTNLRHPDSSDLLETREMSF